MPRKKSDKPNWRLAGLEALHRIARLLLATASLDERLDAIKESLRQQGWDRGVIALVDKERDMLRVKAEFGGASGAPMEISVGSKMEDSLRAAILTRRPVIVSQGGDGPGAEPYVVVPLSIKDEVSGIIWLAKSSKDGGFVQEDIDLLPDFANLFALAIDNSLLYEKINELSFVDELTGLPNIRFFRQQLARDLAIAQRREVPLSLLVIDSDSIKAVNDRLGHKAGDALLAKTAQTIKRNVRSMDVVVRYGGDEFAVILLYADCSAAYQIALRVARAVQAIRLDVQGTKVRTTVSIGVASYPHQAADADGLFAKADQAMYEAKKSGGNCVFPPPHLCRSSNQG